MITNAKDEFAIEGDQIYYGDSEFWTSSNAGTECFDVDDLSVASYETETFSDDSHSDS